ncbi:DUF4298 domain-containing protein [Dolosicoccus paucivorans]|uniref:DUF4298 domain-containing protein n=1 Tax=Dolosicoccus paucivorans TaxID=84521 RepID=UPI00087E3F13|nr:DUF4298 domain-containing protein [Dolosicoccus paucivorans]SDI45532.1 protein of unknown function [Dolosicoccus paucivorans]
MSTPKDFVQMEENYLKVDQAVQSFESELAQFKEIIPNIRTLTNYYGSKEWLRHQQLDKSGEIDYPTTAVLGEDYAYNTLVDVRQIGLEMLEIATELLKEC